MNIPGIWWIVVILSASALVLAILSIQLYEQLKKEKFRHKSLSTRYGQITEQFLPLVETYPWNPSNFRFLGSPIDGIQFEDDRIILVEFKSNSSHMSKRQRELKALVEAGKVEFQVIKAKL